MIRPVVRPSVLAARTALLGLCAASLLAGCQTQPRIAGANVQVQPEGRLAAVNPSDIAIAPLENLSPIADVPELELRRAAATFLPRKRYSPLKLENVDGALVGVEPATYRPGTLREDAVLELTVHAWDTSLWDLRRTLIVDIEARLVESSGQGGPALWTGRLSQRFDLTSSLHETGSGSSLMQPACNRILEELLAPLPSRDIAGQPRTTAIN
jgi:hypothetical protein